MIRDIGYLEILKTNPGSSIQDKGRIRQGQYGIPASGAMDQLAQEWINHMLKNDPNAAVIEILQPGFKCGFDSFTRIGLAGAQAEVKINGEVTTSILINIKPGDELEIGRFMRGSILYLGILEGFQSELKLESRSFYPKITVKSVLSKSDKIPFFTNHFNTPETYATVKIPIERFGNNLLKVYPGPDFNALSPENQKQIFKSKFTISTLANRMAFQLNELLPNSIDERMTAPVYPGTVQLTSGGKLIILMRDAQTTGGYPRVLQVSEDSLANLAQKKPGTQISFQKTNFEEFE